MTVPVGLAYIALGTNLGDREAHLKAAADFLGEGPLNCLRLSPIYETPPMGPPQPNYLNAVAEVETELGPRALLSHLKAYEVRAGRSPGRRWGPREIDLDLLLLGPGSYQDGLLTVPHPGLTQRDFVLQPLCDLAPELVVPGQTRTVRALLAALELPPLARFLDV